MADFSNIRERSNHLAEPDGKDLNSFLKQCTLWLEGKAILLLDWEFLPCLDPQLPDISTTKDATENIEGACYVCYRHPALLAIILPSL